MRVAPISAEQSTGDIFLARHPQRKWSLRFVDADLELRYQLESCQRHALLNSLWTSVGVFFAVVFLSTYPYEFTSPDLHRSLTAFAVVLEGILWGWVSSAYMYGAIMKRRHPLGKTWLQVTRTGLLFVLFFHSIRQDAVVPVCPHSVGLAVMVFAGYFLNVPFYWLPALFVHLPILALQTATGTVTLEVIYSDTAVLILCIAAGLAALAYFKEKRDRMIFVIWLRIERQEFEVSKYMSSTEHPSHNTSPRTGEPDFSGMASFSLESELQHSTPERAQRGNKSEHKHLKASDSKILRKTNQFITNQISVARKLTEELQKANGDAGRVAGLMHSELKHNVEKLTSLLIQLRDDSLPDMAKRVVTKMEGACQSLMTTLSSVSDLECADSGKIAMLREPVDLSEVAEKAVAQHQRLLTDSRILVSVSVRGPQRVVGDSNRIKQVVAQMIERAVLSSRKGAEIMVEVATKEQGLVGKVEVTVSGSARAGDRVVQDVGLAVCGKLCKLMHGQLLVEEGPDKIDAAGFRIVAHLYLPLINKIEPSERLNRVQCVVRVQSAWLQQCVESGLESAGATIPQSGQELVSSMDAVVVTDRVEEAVAIIATRPNAVATDVVLLQRDDERPLDIESLTLNDGSKVFVVTPPFTTRNIVSTMRRYLVTQNVFGSGVFEQPNAQMAAAVHDAGSETSSAIPIELLGRELGSNRRSEAQLQSVLESGYDESETTSEYVHGMK